MAAGEGNVDRRNRKNFMELSVCGCVSGRGTWSDGIWLQQEQEKDEYRVLAVSPVLAG